VYGTLRQKERAHNKLGLSKFVEEVRVDGFDMYNLGGFPGIIKGKGSIVGETYELPEGVEGEAVLGLLDYYEGYFPDRPDRSAYVREEIDVNGKPTFVYVLNNDKTRDWYKPVPSGDWRNIQ
jgi:gamma-glutamylcyclotransferase (GGCT)/AIG2-like uncharacterized protein YtfP